MATMNREERAEKVRERVKETCKLDPSVQIILGDHTYTLLYNNRAAKDILSDTGRNILHTPLTMGDLNDPSVLGSVIHRGLQAKHPTVTVDEIDAAVNVRHLLYVQSQISMALGLFYPDISDLPLPDGDAPEVSEGDPT